MILDPGERHLVGPEGPLHGLPIHDLGPRPALEGPQHEGRPARASRDPVLPRGSLDVPDPRVAGVQRRGERLVNARGLLALDEEHLVSVAFDQLPDLLVA